MKTLKINDVLHDDLKTHASNTGFILQDLVEKKLNEIVDNDESTFQSNDIQYFKNNNLFSLLLTPKDFQLLISLLKKLCINEKISNVDQLKSILDSITKMQLSYEENFKNDDVIETNDNKEILSEKENLNTENKINESFFDTGNTYIKNIIENFNFDDNPYIENNNNFELNNLNQEILKESHYTNEKKYFDEKQNYVYSKFWKVKVSKEEKEAIIKVANENDIKNKGGILEKSIYFNLYLYRNVKDVTILPENKLGVIEVIGFSKVDGSLIFRIFEKTNNINVTIQELLKFNTGKTINDMTKVLSLPNLVKLEMMECEVDQFNHKELPKSDNFSLHIDRGIFNKHYLCDLTIQDKTGKNFLIEDVNKDLLKLSNGKNINLGDLINYHCEFIDDEIIEKYILKGFNNLSFKIYFDKNDTELEKDLSKLDDFIKKLINKTGRKRNIKIHDNLYFLNKSLTGKYYHFAGYIYELNLNLKTELFGEILNETLNKDKY